MKINMRAILFTIIIIVCIVSVGFGAYLQFFKPKIEANNQEMENQINEELLTNEMADEFKKIFSNTLDYQNMQENIGEIAKIKEEQDLVYTWVTKESTVENRYDLKLNIPRVNIASSSAQKFNDKIKEVYVAKANDIIVNSTKHTIYTVEYMSYINSNILSLVIKSTLKEENNPQRLMIQTYNYNLSTNEEVTFEQMLEIRGLQAEKVKQQVLSQVQQSNKEAETLRNLGYVVHIRDLTSDVYEPKNTNNFILGKDNYLYIIYPYGNTNYTDEMDVIVM